jgi:glycosyltransferase involved in cell wall biosynthesis
MKNILAFCFFPAFVPPTNGGQSRLFHFYKALSRWHRITLLTSTHIGVEEEVINHGLNFIERRIPKDEHFVDQYGMLEQYSSGGDLSGPAIAACGKLPTLLHKAYLEEYKNAHALIFDDPFTAQCDLFVGTDQKPRVYNSYNCESLLYKQIHISPRSRPIHELVRDAEAFILTNSDLVLYCNDGDLAEFVKIAPTARFEAIYAPNGMMPTALGDCVSISGDKKFRAVFMGSGHPPNVQAAKFIANSLAPALQNIHFDIIGDCLPEGYRAANLTRHGVVDDVIKSEILQRSDIALNPMSAGSGSNVKVLEYFAYCLPVLSTKFGMRGIEAIADRDYLEASLENFTQALQKAASDPSTQSSIARAGKSLALDSYTWQSIARPVAERVEDLACIKGESIENRFVLAINDHDSFTAVGGGGTRTRGLYETVREWSPVIFISFSSDGTLCSRKHDKSITVINVPKTREHTSELARINEMFHISVDDIIASIYCTTNPWLRLVYGELRQSARCIVIEHCYMASLPLAFGDRFLYSSQNNETELKQNLLNWHPLKEELLTHVERIEGFAVERSAATFTVSMEDAVSLVKGRRTAGPVIVVPNGASIPAVGEEVKLARCQLSDRIGDRSAVFLGSAHMPNVEAVNFIVERLAIDCPDVEFHILGSVCSAIQHAPKNVTIWGLVDEVTKSAVFELCAIALNPVESGSGSNVKLADYLLHGLFVVTTQFGQRGYPATIQNHIIIATLDAFHGAISNALGKPELYSTDAIKRRRALFHRELSIQGIAKRFCETLQELEINKKRVLYVLYRYVSPALGGAETNIEKFISALGKSGKFDIDVIAPEISGIHNHLRFSETYSFNSELGVPVDIPNVRFARFPASPPTNDQLESQLRKAWAAEPNFEKFVDISLQEAYEESGITWGWCYPEGEGPDAARWALSGCGVFLRSAARIELEGYAPNGVVLTIFSGDTIIEGPMTLNGQFSLTLDAREGHLRLETSAQQLPADPRPLGIRVSRLTLGRERFDLSLPSLLQKYLPLVSVERCFHILDKAAEESRQGVRLTDGRGPWSDSLERYISDHVAEYDLVVTHNNIFRPATVAIAEAKKHGVPSILIPHAHLDDDFYHFQDWLECAQNASIVLVVPRAACHFLTEKGCNVRYLSAGCDASEEFTLQDQEAFNQIYSSKRQFFLVLGRKAGAKGYQQIIKTVDQLNREGLDLQAVLIGPDDDGIPVDSPNVVYLGRQPRNIVRGALLSCVALCNMSSSESFGIVILEAWLAGKPVIANKNCAAFHDMAVHNQNALLVEQNELADAMRRVCLDPELRERLADEGKKLVEKFEWSNITEEFLDICFEEIKKGCH